MSLRKLNHLDFSQENINELINFISKKIVPTFIKTQQQLKTYQDKYKDFTYDSKTRMLCYEPTGQLVIPSDSKQQVLEKMYEQDTALGKGQNNWYRYISQYVLGITKREAIEFLKSKEIYQLTRDPIKTAKRPLVAIRPFHIFAIDLVDLNQYIGIKENKKFRYVLTCVDLFSGYTWYKPLKNKEPRDVLKAFDSIVAESSDHLPSIVLNDNGNEFLGEFNDYLTQNKVKHIFTKTYTPQPNVESANNQLRKIMKQFFVKYNKLAWLPFLPTIQQAKNTQYNENLGETPDQILTAFEDQDTEHLNNLSEKQLKKKKSEFKQLNNNLLQVGDFVRIRLSSQQTELRNKIKAGKKKLIIVHFSPDIYRVKQVYKPKTNKLSQYEYTVESLDGNKVVKTGSNISQRFTINDLLKVTANQKNILSQKNADTLNRLRNPEDIEIQGREKEPVEVAITREKTIVLPKEKAIEDYKSAEWTKFLKDKEFTDEGKRFKIVDVFYEGRTYICEVKNVKSSRVKNEFYTLYAVLKEANREDWWKTEFKQVIERLEKRDA